MNLMGNKYLKFPIVDFRGQKVRNITELNILPDIPEKYLGIDYILTTKLEDNKLLEAVSYTLYETTDYWDLLMKINDMRNMNLLPVDYDTVLIRAKRNLGTWIKAGKLMDSQNLTEQYNDVLVTLGKKEKVKLIQSNDSKSQDEIVKRKYLELLDEEVLVNEKYRNFKYISLGDMVELESVLLTSQEEAKIPSGLIINPSKVQ